MTKKFKTLPKIQTLQLVRNANRILLNKYHNHINEPDKYEGFELDEITKDLNTKYNEYEASEIALSQYLNQ